jgi:hypothetical protein
MNKLSFITLSLGFLCVNSRLIIGENEKSSSIMNCAFKNITKSIVNKQREISIVNFGSDMEIINSIVQKDSNLSYKIKNMKKVVGNERHETNESAIMLFDNLKSLSEFNRKSKFINKGPKSFQFIIHIPGATINEISASISELKLTNFKRINEITFPFMDVSEIVHFQYFIVDERHFLKLFTFIWFSPSKCGEQQIVEVNQFNKKTKLWQNSNFAFDKFKNFHSCTLNVLGYYILGQFERNHGVLDKILMVLEKSMNFKMDLKTHRFDGSIKRVYFKNYKIDLFVFTTCLPIEAQLMFYNASGHITHPFCSAVDVLMVSPGEAYSGYEKLILAFDSPTWFLIGLTFFAAFVTVFIVRFLSAKVQDFIYGSNVSSPTLHVFVHFFGLGQVILPQRNFPRFLLMIFILFSLIIRTAYQGKMFEFLQKEMRKPEMQSIEEMIENNFTFHMENCDGDSYYQHADRNWCGLPRR